MINPKRNVVLTSNPKTSLDLDFSKSCSIDGATSVRNTTATILTGPDGRVEIARINEARFQNARRVENLLTTTDLSISPWSSAGTPTISLNQTDMLGGSTAYRFTMSVAANYILNSSTALSPLPVGGVATWSIDLKSASGSNQNIILLLRAGNNSTALISTNIVVTPTWQRFSVKGIPNTVLGAYVWVRPGDGTDTGAISEARDIYVARPSLNDVTGLTNQAPPEFISVAILPPPYHGAGVTQVKYFTTTNANSVSSNVVTEVVGTPLSNITLLSEGTSSNTIKQSAVNATGWSGSTYTTVTANTYIAPNGATEMGQVLAKATNGFHLARQSNIVISAGINTVSGYLRYVNNRWVGVQIYDGASGAFACFDLLNGVVGSRSAGATASTLTATTQANVYKFTMTTVALNSVSNGLCDIELRVADGSIEGAWVAAGTECCGAWGIQVEPGTSASSTIPTTTTALTRTGDSISFTGSDLGWYNPLQGTFVVNASGSVFSSPYNLGTLGLTYPLSTKYILDYNNLTKVGSAYLYTLSTLSNPTELTGISTPTTLYLSSGGVANITSFKYYPRKLKTNKLSNLL
jgi:hypothetical protein